MSQANSISSLNVTANTSAGIDSKKSQSVGELMRYWRKHSRLSQLDLALQMGSSSKHLSFVETGRSHPSRGFILTFCDVLNLSLRQRNAVLLAANYSPQFQEIGLQHEAMQMVRDALQRMLTQHEPYPAIVVDSSYRILMHNGGYSRLAKQFLGDDKPAYDNAILMFLKKDGFYPFLQHREIIVPFLLNRLRDEASATNNMQLQALIEALCVEHQELLDEVQAMSANSQRADDAIESNLPVMTFTLKKDELAVTFFTTITTMGTPLDLTCQELRIELLFPADNTTRQGFLLDD